MPAFLAVRYFPDYEAEWFESLCSPAGTLFEGRFVLVHPEAGYQANILRSGLWCACWLCRHLRNPGRFAQRLLRSRKTAPEHAPEKPDA
jgi:hypothetical protein